MEKESLYFGFIWHNSLENHITNIANIPPFTNYNSLERQVNQVQSAEEPEDLPEPMHTPWGVWLHHWDALHGIDQRYDAAHVLRTANYAMDILHYANYVPVIGDIEPKIKTYELNLEYDYLHQEFFIYDAGMEFEEEDIGNTELIIGLDNEEELVDSDNIGCLDISEEENLAVDTDKRLKNDIDFEFDGKLESVGLNLPTIVG